ncbi:MAG: flagellar export chaperone FliS [Verrucomicrobiota bacterium]
MRTTDPLRSYRQVATQTAPPGQLVLMLYEGAIRFLERALDGFRHEDPAAFNETISNNILRAQAILHELNVSLNMEAGGEFSATMRRLYDYLDRRLLDSNLRKDDAGIRETINRLTALRDAWSAMLNGDGPALAAGTPKLGAQLVAA